MDTSLRITRGDDEIVRIRVREPIVDGDGEPVLDENGQPTYQPVDLAGATLWWFAKASRDDLDDDAEITKRTGAGIETIAPSTDGIAEITIDAADTAALAAGTRYHELQGQLAGKIRTLVGGRLKIVGDLVQTTTP